MSYKLEITIPSLPPMNTAATRRHWAVHHRETKRWRAIVCALVGRRRPPKPLARARIEIVRRSSSEPDMENMCFAAKPLVDALCFGTGRANVLVDDRPSVLERTYRWEPAPRGKGSMRIVVEEIA